MSTKDSKPSSWYEHLQGVPGIGPSITMQALS